MNSSFTKKTLRLRLKRFQELLKKQQQPLCLIENPIDLFYLTGLKFSTGVLLISPKSAKLLVDGRYIQSAKEAAPMPSHLLTKGEIASLVQKSQVKTVVFDSTSTSYARYSELKKEIAGVKLLPLASPLKALRLIKGEEELQAMRASAKLIWKGYLHIKKVLKVGITEREVANELENYCKKLGSDGMSFEPIIAFGKNSAMPHYRAGDYALKKNDIVLIDIGASLNSYQSDMTRVFFFGKEDPLLGRYLKIVKEASRAALQLCKAGTEAHLLDKAAREVMRKEKVEKHFLHSLGHGIGLETHEFPTIRCTAPGTLLQKGMVITVEPGLYLPGKGGVRYENTVIVTEKGYENLYPEKD
jgi:Xaa-Pro aminopeptidase